MEWQEWVGIDGKRREGWEKIVRVDFGWKGRDGMGRMEEWEQKGGMESM